jgi:hypothetical protein
MWCLIVVADTWPYSLPLTGHLHLEGKEGSPQEFEQHSDILHLFSCADVAFNGAGATAPAPGGGHCHMTRIHKPTATHRQLSEAGRDTDRAPEPASKGNRS